uniref:dolichyl-P-Man:Man5GlcNAc2-PP-dolichol alpha-1,3-mannosyltransferase n=1 Tax=Anoplophora glabripennis TaxID=217634 RepID=V5GLL3_ANOGL
MAPPKNKRPQSGTKSPGRAVYLKKYFTVEFLKKLLFDPHYLTPVCILLIVFEMILNVFIIERVKYTEIDWNAYMQEVEGFLNGTLDYKELRGDTGPLVYPAGFVYIYTIFYYVTSHGENIYLAQYIFLVLYLIQTLLVQRIFKKTLKLPPYALIIATLTSYRIHSIFVLRLFNDPIAVLLFYASLNLFISNKWILGSIFYSLAVSVKMNILLYAPCLLLAYLTNMSLFETIIHLFICGVVQLILGLPFYMAILFHTLKVASILAGSSNINGR